MPRTKTASKTSRAIRSATDRAALPVSRTIVWERVSKGRRLGYRKEASGGVWVASVRNDDRTYTNATLGTFDEHSAALKAANRWFDARQGVQISGRTTVEQVCAMYVEHQRIQKGEVAAQDAAARFRRLLNGDAFNKRELDTLTKQHCLAFRNSLVKPAQDGDGRASRASANRNWTGVRAALNWAYKNGYTATKPWETVSQFKDVHARREVFLTLEQRRTLLDALPGDMRRFAEAMLLTACRPGELFGLNVGDFDKHLGTLTIRSSKTKRRTATLSSAARKFFVDLTKDRIGNGPLLSRDVAAVRKGEIIDFRLDKEYVKRFMRPAVDRTGLPIDTVAYSLRHTAITEMLLAGMDATVVALLAGTSTTMIERSYAHLQGDKLRAALDRVKMV